MARVFYRVGQFWRGLWATVEPEEWQLVRLTLPPAALPLFARMPTDAQRHSLNVLATLRATGHDDHDLAVAALLHDCGKVAAERAGVRLGLWVRGPLVVADALLPRLVERWASSQPKDGWRYVLYVQREHAAIGAAWAAQAGCSALSCWLISQHQSKVDEAQDDQHALARDARVRPLLAALQQADNDH